ncbi:MAG: DNA polymerase I [bacterium]
MTKEKNLFIIDGSSYIFRAFFGVPHLSNSSGFPTNAVYGFLKMIKNTLETYHPDHVVITLDSKEETFRKKMYPEYKANREAMPEELVLQVPKIYELMDALNLHTLRVNGVEADDIIATLKRISDKKGHHVTIISGDKDLMQLVDDKTVVLDTMKNRTYNEQGVIEKLGVPPKYVADVLAIMGDASDNIPGVRGIGAKGAAKLVNEYGSVEDIYSKIDSIKNKKHHDALVECKDDALLSKRLTILKDDVKIDFREDDFAVQEPDMEKLTKLLKEMEFISELREFGLIKKDVKASSSQTQVNAHDIKTIAKYAVEYKGMLIGHDLQHHVDLDTLQKYQDKIFDTKLAAYVLSPGEKDYDIDDLSVKVAGDNFDTSLFPVIKEKLEAQIKAKGLDRAYYEVDLPCIRVLRDMEETGALVDVKRLEELSTFFEGELVEYTSKIYSLAGAPFNINSPKQLSTVLFDKLGLTTGKKTETGFSTDQEVLMELSASHALPKLIMDYREIAKLKSTYVEPLLYMAKHGEADGRIHTTYHLDVTTTGRLSSTDPNLQNIPIRSAYGAKIREAFIAPKGKKLISADYSQIELRIFAHLSQDPIMIESFKKGEDIHARTASEIFDVSLELVTLNQRREAKAINFGIIYGKTPFGLAKELGITQSVASKIIKRYFERYAGVARVREELVKKARMNGFAETLYGRKRYLPDIASRNMAARNFAERNAINSPLQGTASDIMKIAMTKLWDKLHKEHPDVHITLHVHDELIIETPEHIAEKISHVVKHEMENAVKLTPMLVVDVNIGDTWLAAH